MPRLRPPPSQSPIDSKRLPGPVAVAVALLEAISASTLSADAKAAAKMLALNNLVLGRVNLSSHRKRHRIPPLRDEFPRMPDRD